MAATLAALTAAFVAGCGDEDAPTTTTTAERTGGGLVVYEREGGVAYTAQRMAVEPDGSATVDVEGPGDIHVEFHLANAELKALNGLLESAEPDLDSPPEPSGCADCFEYTISYRDRTASFDDTNLPPSIRALVELLGPIVERETPSGPAREGQ